MHDIRITENKHKEKNIVMNHHHEVHQILYVLENEGSITFNDTSYPFTQDSLAFITPYSKHSIISDGKMTVLVLEFDLAKLNIEQMINYYSFNQTKLIKLNQFEAGEVRQLFRRMLYEESQGEAINLFAMRIYLAELLLILLRSQNEPPITDANVLRAERLKKYIDTHYFEIANANDISQKLGVSTRHVNTIFKERFHVTPMKYLNEVRMEVSKKLLIESDKDIASICFEVGFEGLSTFYRRFKEYTNLTPNKFRLKYAYEQSE